MKVFVSVDMEGISGVERLEEIFRGLPGYDVARQLMAGDTNAVVQGALSGGADEVLVSDSHAYMCNLRPKDLIADVPLRRGQLRRRWCQMKGFDSSFDAVLLVGYHAKAGTPDAILAHTWIPSFLDVRVNGQSVPEPSLNTWLAGAFGVPVVMLSGDDVVISQSQPVLGDIHYAQVKKSVAQYTGEHLALADSRRLLRETAREAVANARKHPLVRCELPVTVELDLASTLPATDDNRRYTDVPWATEALSDVDAMLATHPQIESPKQGTVAFTCPTFEEAYATLHSLLGEVYERDIEGMIDTSLETVAYTRSDLAALIGDHSITELGTSH